MILLPFFDNLAGFRFRKNALKSDVHSLRRPCLGGHQAGGAPARVKTTLSLNHVKISYSKHRKPALMD